MDDLRFDHLIRAVSARFVSRRKGLAGLAVTALACAAGHSVAVAAPSSERCLANGRRCGQNSGNRGGPCKKCCSRYTTVSRNGVRRCTCIPDNETCGNSSQCCNGTCDSATRTCGDGTCLAAGELCTNGDRCCAPSSCGPANYVSTFGLGAVDACVLAIGQPCLFDEECTITAICSVTSGGGSDAVCCYPDGEQASSAAQCCSGEFDDCSGTCGLISGLTRAGRKNGQRGSRAC